jgi:hypothetical protein
MINHSDWLQTVQPTAEGHFLSDKSEQAATFLPVFGTLPVQISAQVPSILIFFMDSLSFHSTSNYATAASFNILSNYIFYHVTIRHY